MPIKTKTTMLELRIEPEQKAAWQASAEAAGLTLSAYVRRAVDEGRALEQKLELLDTFGADWHKHTED